MTKEERKLKTALSELKQRIIFAKMKDEAARAAREFVLETCAEIIGVPIGEIASDSRIYFAMREAINGEIPIADAVKIVEERARESQNDR